jgi:glycosyltransferase involved in cell wall biosynthesis
MASPTRILFLTDLYPHHPTEPLSERSRALHYFVRQWAARPDIDVRVVIPERYQYGDLWRRSHWRETWHLEGVPVALVRLWHLPKSTLGLWVSNLRRHLADAEFTPDVIVSHMPNGTWCAVQLNRTLRRPHVCGLHNSDVHQMRLGFGYYYEAHAFAYRSRSVQRRAREVFVLPEGFLAESGVPRSEILPEAEYLALRLHRPLRVLSVCRLRGQKRIDAVLRALARLPGELTWTYDLLGDGEDRQALEALARELGVTERVTFHGERPRAACLHAMERADIFVMIGGEETFGLVYLEAMAKGDIVIGARGTGIDGVVVHGDNGFLCEPGNAEELCATLQELAARDLQPVRRRAFETIRGYTEEARAAAYLDYVLDIARTARPPGGVR